MWEECLIDLQQGPLIVDKEIKDVTLVFACEVRNFDSVFGQLCKA